MTATARARGGARGGRDRLRSGATLILLGVWLAATSLVSATLLARHVFPLPDGGAPDARLGPLRPANEEHQWLLLHVLYAGCKCSERIVHHLSERGRIPDVSELVIWAGEDARLERELASAHFPIRRMRFEDLDPALGVTAVPMLIISDQEDHLLYRGGYTERKQAYEIDDVALLARARLAGEQKPHPIFGCATSAALEQRLDPLDLL